MNFNALQLIPVALVAAISSVGIAQDSALTLDPGDKVLIVGNTFAERLDESGYFASMMYASHPDHDLVVRSVAWSADTVTLRPRETKVPTMLEHVDTFDPDVVFMFFGMTESFDGAEGVEAFGTGLSELMERVGTKADGTARELVLVTPIMHESLDPGEFGAWPSNESVFYRIPVIMRYAGAMMAAAESDEHAHAVNLYHQKYPDTSGPMTTNGIHPSDEGAFWYSREIGEQLGWVGDSGAVPDSAIQREFIAAAADKHYYQRLIYRPTNTEYVFGRRHEPYGSVNFPAEFEQLERMTEARESRIWDMPKPTAEDLFSEYDPETVAPWASLPLALDLPEDSWTPPEIEAKGRENSLGDLTILPPEEFTSSFTMADGYVVEIFASEQDFEELANPLAMTFDERGRLWVLCAITYPHLLPGEDPRCKLLILEDTNNNGKADTRTIFADRLYIPTGFAVDSTIDGATAVYIGQAPDLLRLTDLDGDDRADTREIVATGFGMPDSHHQVSAFEWDPAGGIMFHEGVFTKSQVETPYGPRRVRDAAAWRFDPRTERLEVMSRVYFNNPWGLAFDDFGAGILIDASGGENFALSHVVHNATYPRVAQRPPAIINRGRPTAGGEIIASRHFPDDVQDSFLVNQSIGFHGTRWDQLTRAGSSWSSKPMPMDIISSSDTNFRPVAMEIGPDGALYIVDWCNPLIGHMQYSTRDPRRDSSHGRVWRVRHETRPLLEAPEIAGASVNELLELLRLPERNTRQLVRRKIQQLPSEVIEGEVFAWFDELDEATDLLYDRLMLEKLWLCQATGRVDLELLKTVAGLRSERARSGAIRALRVWVTSEDVTSEQAAPIVEAAVTDPSMHVRLEGVVAAGFLELVEGERIASLAADLPMDSALGIVLRETLVHLTEGRETDNVLVRRMRLEQMNAENIGKQEMDGVVAAVMVTRRDLPASDRLNAVSFASGGGESARVAYLVGQMREEKREDSVRAMGELLRVLIDGEGEITQGEIEAHDAAVAAAVEAGETPPEARVRWAGLSGEQLSSFSGELVAGLESQTSLAGDVAVSVLIEHGLEPGVVSRASPERLVSALSMLEAGTVEGSVLGAVRAAVEGDEVAARDAIEQIARHKGEGDYPELFAWMSSMIDAVENTPVSAWSPGHSTAMAAARAMNGIEAGLWPEGFEAYTVESPSDEIMSLGEMVYHDEAIGCVRCHGADGTGLEGFPALSGSARLLGNPERGASIVSHGMYGELTTASGETFNSAMAPLGSNLTDEQIGAVLTYARRSWSNFASPVSLGQVAAGRANAPQSGVMWTTAAMNAAYPLTLDGVMGPIEPGADSPPVSRGGGVAITPMMILGGAVAFFAVLIGVFGFIVVKTKKPG